MILRSGFSIQMMQQAYMQGLQSSMECRNSLKKVNTQYRKYLLFFSFAILYPSSTKIKTDLVGIIERFQIIPIFQKDKIRYILCAIANCRLQNPIYFAYLAATANCPRSHVGRYLGNTCLYTYISQFHSHIGRMYQVPCYDTYLYTY